MRSVQGRGLNTGGSVSSLVPPMRVVVISLVVTVGSNPDDVRVVVTVCASLPLQHERHGNVSPRGILPICCHRGMWSGHALGRVREGEPIRMR